MRSRKVSLRYLPERRSECERRNGLLGVQRVAVVIRLLRIMINNFLTHLGCVCLLRASYTHSIRGPRCLRLLLALWPMTT
jgi:hypothetical protein